MRIREVLHLKLPKHTQKNEVVEFLARHIPDRDLDALAKLHPFYSIPLWQGDPALDILYAWAANSDGMPNIRQEAVFSKKELDSAHLLTLRVDRAPKGESGSKFGVRYDTEGACPSCGTGSKQIGPLLLRASDVPKKGDVSSTYEGEELVSDKVAHVLISELGVQDDLRQVVNRRDGQKLPWWQIYPRHILPRLAPETTGVIRDPKTPPCPVCQRNGHFGTVEEPLVLAYRSSDVAVDADEFPHFSSTWERFGLGSFDSETGTPRWLAPGPSVVSQAVRQIFVKLKVRGAKFTPVTILD